MTRGCGELVPGGFYAQADPPGPNGALWAVVFTLGSGLVEGENCLARVPARQMLLGDPGATLLSGEFVPSDIEIVEQWQEQGLDAMVKWYRDLSPRAGGAEALVDHVGSNHYSPFSFIDELAVQGPSRRIPERLARELVDKTPIPIYFTHSDIPLFKNEAQRDRFIELMLLGDTTKPDDLELTPTWFRDDWGLYAREDHYNGRDHYMIGVLAMLDRLKERQKWESDQEVAIQRFWEMGEIETRLTYAEQLFAASWITRIAYVAKDDDSSDELNRIANNGIEIISKETETE